MTVRDLIEELEEYPMDLPVVNDLKEISDIEYERNLYYLDKFSDKYIYSDAIVLRW